MKNGLLLILAFAVWQTTLHAQERKESIVPKADPFARGGSGLIIDDSYSAEEMVMDFFNGTVVTPSNIQLIGNPSGMAFFEAANTNLGVPAGIMLASGIVHNALGPNTQGAAGNSLGMSGHPDLNTIIGQVTFDATVLTFDFVSEKPDLNFRYVFGSEEYPEYVCSYLNDVFGFFVSGPGISGPYLHNGENYALVPMKTQYVGINTINPGVPGAFGNASNCLSSGGLSNAQYYVDNSGGSELQYDGFTVPLDAKFTVIPGEVYKAIIAVADAGDAIFDSGVFISIESLEGDSLLSPVASLQVTHPDKYSATLSGHAKYAYKEWAYHYNGETFVTLEPVTLQFAEPGIYTAWFTAENYCCTDTTWMNLYIDLPPHLEEAKVDVPRCHDSNDGRIALDVRSSIGGLTYAWNDGGDGAVRENLPPGQYQVTVTDAEGNVTISEIFDLWVEPLEAEVKASKFRNTPHQPVEIFAQGGTSPFLYHWSDGGSGPIRGDLASGQSYLVEVSDARGCVQEVSFTYQHGLIGPAHELAVFPNPANAHLRFRMAPEATATSGMIRVTNLLGQTLYTERVSLGQQRDLDVSRWPEGIYLIHFESDRILQTQKVLVRR